MRKAFIQLHTAVFLAGFTAVLGKLIGLNESLLVWYRLLITVSILCVLMFFRRQLQRIPLVDVLKICCVGFIVVVHWVCFYGSVKYGNISIAVVCFSATGFFTAFFEPLIYKRRIIVSEILLGLLAISGIYIIFDFHPQYKTGIIFGIISAVGSSLFPIFNKRLLLRFTPATLTLYELGGGLLVLSLLIPVYLWQFPAAYYLPTRTDLAWLFVLAAFCTVLSFDLQLNALRKLSPFTANIAYNMEPVYGIILAFIFFQENKLLDMHFYLGVMLIVLSVVFQTLRVWHARRANRFVGA
jgi:drug/metabolite transporter (DMT)-like permease